MEREGGEKKGDEENTDEDMAPRDGRFQHLNAPTLAPKSSK